MKELLSQYDIFIKTKQILPNGKTFFILKSKEFVTFGPEHINEDMALNLAVLLMVQEITETAKKLIEVEEENFMLADKYKDAQKEIRALEAEISQMGW